MNVKTFLKAFVSHYFVIYGLTMLMTLIWCAASGERTMNISYLGYAALFALAADAPLAVFISGDELSRKQWLIRVAIHGALLETLLMPIGYFIGMWRGIGGGFAFFFSVLAVDAIMYVLNYIGFKVDSNKINKRILSRRTQCEEEKERDAKQR